MASWCAMMGCICGRRSKARREAIEEAEHDADETDDYNPLQPLRSASSFADELLPPPPYDDVPAVVGVVQIRMWRPVDGPGTRAIVAGCGIEGALGMVRSGCAGFRIYKAQWQTESSEWLTRYFDTPDAERDFVAAFEQSSVGQYVQEIHVSMEAIE